MIPARFIRILFFLPLVIAPASCGPSTKTPARQPYAWRSPEFHRFVEDSYRFAGVPNPDAFYDWWEKNVPLPNGETGTWEQWIEKTRAHIDSLEEPDQRAAVAGLIAAELHKSVKKGIPKFSLDRGFEFTNTVKLGERQCFLQSIVIAALLQALDLDAGVVMVSGNEKGQETNNAHAIAVLKLANGTDLQVDASEKEPYSTHKGLFVDIRGKGYRYVKPVYRADAKVMTGYIDAGTGKQIAVNDVRGLDYAFQRSQFQYYRGERAPGGFIDPKPTPAGIKNQVMLLKQSVEICPGNPLAVFMLGRAYDKSGDAKSAAARYRSAYALYTKYGWVPGSVKGYVPNAKAKAK